MGGGGGGVELQGLRLAETPKHWFLLLKQALYLPHVLLFAIDNRYPLFPLGVHLLFFFSCFLRTHESQEGIIRSVRYRDGNNKSHRVWAIQNQTICILTAYIHVHNKAVSGGL